MEYRPFNHATDYEAVINLELRESDKKELDLTCGHNDYKQILKQCLETSLPDVTYVFTLEGRIVGVYGIAHFMGNVHVPWLLCTETLTENSTAFLKVSRKIFKELTPLYPNLFNYVDPRNTSALAWIKWLGFTVYDNRPLMLTDLDEVERPVYKFTLGETDYV